MAELATTVWSRVRSPKFLWALLVVAPSVFAYLTGLLVDGLIDPRVRAAAAARDARALDLAALDSFTKQIEGMQLLRGAFLLGLNADHADMASKIALDHLFRLNVQPAVRRVAAIVYPDRWKAETDPLETLVDNDYDAAAIPRLQELENKVDGDAVAKLTVIQEEVNALSSRHEALQQVHDRVSKALTVAGAILSVFVFLLKQEAPGGAG